MLTFRKGGLSPRSISRFRELPGSRRGVAILPRAVKRRAPLLALLASCGLFAGCGDEKPMPTEVGDPSDNATFTRVQQQVFTPKCALSGCHLGPANLAQEGLVLSAGFAYANIVGVRANQNPSLFRISPGDHNNSYLVRKISPNLPIVGDRMPQEGSITIEQRQLVVDWVLRGAPND